MSAETDVKKTFVGTLIRLAEKDPRIVVLDADLMRCAGTEAFKLKFPKRYVQVGVAEANMLGMAGGLALAGKIPFASSFAGFIARRACDHGAIAINYNRANAKICGLYAGLSCTKNGGTHISVEDIAIFRSFPKMVVVSPGDCAELEQAIEALAAYEGPAYLRMVRGPMTPIMPVNYKFEIGKATHLSHGPEAAIITEGLMSHEALKAVEILGQSGIRPTVLNVGTIKPLDKAAILEAAKNTQVVVSVENHSVMGGLGSAVAETLAEGGMYKPFLRIGMPDEYGETADLSWQLDHFGMSAAHIAAKTKKLLETKLTQR